MTNEEYCEQWFEKYRHEVTRGAISDLWNMATTIEREACAKVCDAGAAILNVMGDREGASGAMSCAGALRIKI